MSDDPIRLLLVGGNPGDRNSIWDLLAQEREQRFALTAADRLAAGLEHLAQDAADIVLLDLLLPDSEGMAALHGVRSAAPTVPVVVLTDTEAEALGLEAVREGAQDYLIKGQVDRRLLVRSIRCSIERQRQPGNQSLNDPLTGLYNRRGFFAVAEQYLKLARRTQRSLVFTYLDVDGLKRINDSFGHTEGDWALNQLATVLRSTFRESDIMARMGVDEFGLLALGATDRNADALAGRLGESLRLLTARAARPYELSLSVGMVWFNPDEPLSAEELVAKGEAAMSEHKRHKRGD